MINTKRQIKNLLPIIYLSFVFLLLFLSPVLADELEYQDRGNRYEGIKPKPVSGYDIELISALVDYQESTTRLPKWFRIKFYLKHSDSVYVTVRELDYKEYYWMDEVTPPITWKQGFDNEFNWQTEVVFQYLKTIKMYDLGAVARLGKKGPQKKENIAPVIFYHSQLPTKVTGYLFTFKTSNDARVTASVRKNGYTEPLFEQTFRRQRADRPFTVYWDSSGVSEGEYTLKLKGFLLDTNDPIEQNVHFYHQPNIK